MNIERFYLSCLSHASYIISSNGDAAVIDPQRDVDIYLDYLSERGLRLRYIIETHLHADFVSGHLELARKSGGEIVMGARANAKFPHRAVVDGDVLEMGSVQIRILETPGHTPESVTVMVTDSATPDAPIALFTGDTLFAGDVGRPDLLDTSGIRKEDLAGMLYDSLHQKVLTLPDDTRVYPAHGAGSSCGKALRDVEFTTIGSEKLSNYALKPMTREEFIETVIEGQPEAPSYFARDAVINRSGAPDVDQIVSAARPLGIDEMIAQVDRGALLLDTRTAEEFAQGFIPGSINIGLDGQFATWVGTLIPSDRPIVIVAANGRERESVVRCARVGYDHVVGYLEGGFEGWARTGREIDTFERVEPEELQRMMEHDDVALVIDVRKDTERSVNAISGTRFITLAHLDAESNLLEPTDRPVAIHCAGGYRSSIAASILKNHGFRNVLDLRGGIGAWEKKGLPVVK